MKKKCLFLVMLGMVPAFGMVLMGCPTEEATDPTSITISGVAEVGETLTAVITNPLNPNGIPSENYVNWAYYNDEACTDVSQKIPNIGLVDNTSWEIPLGAQGKWIRASTYGFTGEGENCDNIYSNILGQVPAASVEHITISPTTATVAKNLKQNFTVTINEFVTNSANVVWTVTPNTGGSTITGSGQAISGSTTTQTRELNVASTESSSTLTVKVTYNGKSATATVTVTN